jgi:hypothetical protein
MTRPTDALKETSGGADQGKLSIEDGAQSSQRQDWLAGPSSDKSKPADAGSGRRDGFGGLKNNMTTHWKVAER